MTALAYIVGVFYAACAMIVVVGFFMADDSVELPDDESEIDYSDDYPVRS